tara:strand:- start:95 stop:499 length:405 start_codon:yes stop_codon:yes gene_type:complete
MNEKIRWDQSLVKKFSSSNHFKLLNQLKSEVIKYPLNKKIIKAPIINRENNSNCKSNTFRNSDETIPNNSNSYKYNDTKQSNISFNNSKNFSIYNNNNDSIKEQTVTDISNDQKVNDIPPNLSFQERLDKIDMK